MKSTRYTYPGRIFCTHDALSNGILSKSFFVLVSILILGSGPEAISQKKVAVQEQTWFGYINQSRLTERSGLWVDVHFRMTDHFIKEKTMAIARLAYIYYAGENVRVMGGYAYAPRYKIGVPQIPEHRPWQQIQWFEKKKGFNLSQAFRIEQRFRGLVVDGRLTEEYTFNWRFRYNFSVTVPLTGSDVRGRGPFLLFADEVMVNAGREIINNYFDQNRLFTAFGYQFTSNLNAHLGHLFIFQQEFDAGHYLRTHVIGYTYRTPLTSGTRKA
jgi:hypothetical protein